MNRPEIVSVIQDAGVYLKKRGKDYWAKCPFHSEKTPSFSVNTDKQFFYCFGCGVGGDSLTFIQKLKGISFKEVVRSLNIPTRRETPIERRKKKLRQEFEEWCREYHSDLCTLYRTIQNAKRKVKSIEDLERVATAYHDEPVIEYYLDILDGDDEEVKYELYKETRI